MIRRSTVGREAPRDAAASSMSRSSSSSTGWTERTTKGSVTNSSARRMRGQGVGDVDAERALRAVQRQERQPGDDGGQRERQVDEGVDDALPGKSSRTSTHAMSVPMTALMSTTTNEAMNVSWMAASACGLVMALRTGRARPETDCQMSAAIGMRTIRPR